MHGVWIHHAPLNQYQHMKKIARYTEGFNGSTVRIAYTFTSSNSKTGNVIQQWITPKDWERDKGDGREKIDLKESSDACNECPLMQTCYVKKGFPAMGLISSSKSKNHETLHWYRVPERFKDKFIRFGAFGEPVLTGYDETKLLTELCKNWTGYTHQWRNLDYHWSNEYFMASVEDDKGKREANALGYRTFRVGSNVDEMLHDEVLCPASKEAGRKATCEQCGLCKGKASKAKNIFIVKH